jgi:hypothetical protein
VVECNTCGARYSPLLNALKIEPYLRKEANFELEVIEAVIDTNYRRLIEGRSIDISLGGIHNLVVGSDIEQLEQDSVEARELSAIMADGTGIKQKKGKMGRWRKEKRQSAPDRSSQASGRHRIAGNRFRAFKRR